MCDSFNSPSISPLPSGDDGQKVKDRLTMSTLKEKRKLILAPRLYDRRWSRG